MGTPKGTKPWNAGTAKGWLDQKGYRWIYVTENGRRRAKREHRHVMELHLGRKLEPHEVVHHINHNPSDNRIENLEVKDWGEHTTQHHQGAKHSDQARITKAVFASYRWEHERLKAINQDLLEALQALVYPTGSTAGVDKSDARAVAARAAIRKALGE